MVSNSAYRKKIIGFDTETLNGIVYLISASDKKYLWIDNIEQINETDIKNILDFLLQYDKDKYIGYFYNLDYDIKAIIKSLLFILEKNKQMDNLKLFLKTNILLWEKYRIDYIPNKLFSLRFNGIEKERFYYENNKKITFMRTEYEKSFIACDIAQYFNMKLSEASKTYLNLNKLEIDIGNITIDNIHIMKNKIIEYCLRDSLLCSMLSKYWHNLLFSFTNMKIDKLISPAYISKRYLNRYLINTKTEKNYMVSDILRHEEPILKTYYGGRFETTKKGFNKKLYNYDINSAYPKIISEFKQLNGHSFTDNKIRFDRENCYDIILCSIKKFNEYLNPLAFNKYDSEKQRLIFYPSNEKSIDKWITQNDYNLLLLYGFEPKIKKVLHFQHNNKLLFPFITEWYDKRQQLKKEGNNIQSVIKIMLNSIYGITLENIKKTVEIDYKEWLKTPERERDIITDNEIAIFVREIKESRGLMYNPLFGTLITSGCRYNLLEPIIKNNMQNHIWLLATDGIFTDRTIPHLQISRILGEWDLNVLNNVIIYGNGLYKYDNGKEEKFKTRGFRNTKINDFNQMIKNRGYKKEGLIPLSHYRKYTFEQLHTFKEIRKSFSINDKKRIFPEIDINTLSYNYYDSNPFTI